MSYVVIRKDDLRFSSKTEAAIHAARLEGMSLDITLKPSQDGHAEWEVALTSRHGERATLSFEANTEEYPSAIGYTREELFDYHNLGVFVGVFSQRTRLSKFKESKLRGGGVDTDTQGLIYALKYIIVVLIEYNGYYNRH